MKIKTCAEVVVNLLARERDILNKCGILNSIYKTSFEDIEDETQRLISEVNSMDSKEIPAYLVKGIRLLDKIIYEITDLCDIANISEISFNYKEKKKKVIKRKRKVRL